MIKSDKIVLAVDTCTDVSSVCVGGECLVWRGNRNQSQEILPKISSLMQRVNCDYGDLSGLVAVIGPGSYTGIRIGVSVINTIGLVCDLPIRQVDSLEAQAWLALKEYSGDAKRIKTVVSLISAGGARVYVSKYGVSDDEMVADCSMYSGEVDDFWGNAFSDSKDFSGNENLLVVAEANDVLKNYLKGRGIENLILLDENLGVGRAELAVHYFAKLKEVKKIALPIYLRGPVAEK